LLTNAPPAVSAPPAGSTPRRRPGVSDLNAFLQTRGI
jgi:hypothetical protein